MKFDCNIVDSELFSLHSSVLSDYSEPRSLLRNPGKCGSLFIFGTKISHNDTKVSYTGNENDSVNNVIAHRFDSYKRNKPSNNLYN